MEEKNTAFNRVFGTLPNSIDFYPGFAVRTGRKPKEKSNDLIEGDNITEVDVKIIELKLDLSTKQKELGEHLSVFEKIQQDTESEVKTLEDLNQRAQLKKEEMENNILRLRKSWLSQYQD